jgi:hypothetical protein
MDATIVAKGMGLESLCDALPQFWVDRIRTCPKKHSMGIQRRYYPRRATVKPASVWKVKYEPLQTVRSAICKEMRRMPPNTHQSVYFD